jgi:hypothetical protein
MQISELRNLHSYKSPSLPLHGQKKTGSPGAAVGGAGEDVLN